MTSSEAASKERLVAASPQSWGFRDWAMLVVLCAAFALDTLDNIMVGISVPQIKMHLGLSTASAQWVVSAYVLSFGGFLLLGGRTADLLGRRRVFLAGLAVIAAGSLLGGVATAGVLVIAARFIMGLGAAFTAPSALSIIVNTFPEGPQRNRALGIYTSCGAFGYSTGVIVGGLLTEVSWRLTFMLPVPVAVTALIGGVLLVPRDPARNGARRRYDVAGAVTVTAAMLLFVYAIVEAPTAGWLAARTLGVLAAAAVLLAAFATIESRAREPLLRLGLLRNGGLVGPSLIAAAILGTYMSYQFIGALYLQSYRKWTPLEMALAFLPIGILIMVLAPRAGRLLGRVGTIWMMFAGMAAYTLAFLLFLRIGHGSSYAAVILPCMILIGAGFPFAFTAANVQATSSVAEAEQGLAAGILQTGYQVGAAVVLAVVTARMSAGSVLSGYHSGTWILIIVAAASTAATAAIALARRRRRPFAEASQQPAAHGLEGQGDG